VDKFENDIDRRFSLTGDDLFEAEYTRAASRPSLPLRSSILDDTVFVDGVPTWYTWNPNKGTTTSGIEAEQRRARYAAHLNTWHSTEYQQHEQNALTLLTTIAGLRGIKVTADNLLGKLYRSHRDESVTKGSIQGEDSIPNKIAELLSHPDIWQHYSDAVWIKDVLETRKSPTYDAANEATDIETTPLSAYVPVDDYQPNNREGIVGMTPDLEKYFAMKDAIERRSRSKLEVVQEFGFGYEKKADRWMKQQEHIALDNIYHSEDTEFVYSEEPDTESVHPMHRAYLNLLADEHDRERENAAKLEDKRRRDEKPLSEMTAKERRAKRERDRVKRKNEGQLKIITRRPVLTEAVSL
jgi:hypothetical protein